MNTLTKRRMTELLDAIGRAKLRYWDALRKLEKELGVEALPEEFHTEMESFVVCADTADDVTRMLDHDPANLKRFDEILEQDT